MFAPSLFQLSPRCRRHERREHGPVARRAPNRAVAFVLCGSAFDASFGVFDEVVSSVNHDAFVFSVNHDAKGHRSRSHRSPPPAEPPVVRREISKREVIAVLDVDDDDRLRAHVLSHDVRRDGVEVPAVDEKITVVPHGG